MKIRTDYADPTTQAYYRLKADPTCVGAERAALKVIFLKTDVGDWAYRGLQNIGDWSDTERSRLLCVVEKSGSADTIIWTLRDVEMTDAQQRSLVKIFTDGNLKRESNARRALRELQGYLTSEEVSKLRQLESGKDV